MLAPGQGSHNNPPENGVFHGITCVSLLLRKFALRRFYSGKKRFGNFATTV
jgi:hypothetical protein